MRRGKKLNVRGWEAAETGGTQARHIELRLRVVSAGREVLLRLLTVGRRGVVTVMYKFRWLGRDCLIATAA